MTDERSNVVTLPSIFKPKTQEAPLMLTQYAVPESVLHACIKANCLMLNKVVALEDNQLADDWIATEDGRAVMRGLAGYMMRALGKKLEQI